MSKFNAADNVYSNMTSAWFCLLETGLKFHYALFSCFNLTFDDKCIV